MHGGIRAPWAPRLGTLGERPVGQVSRPPEAEIADRKRIGIAEAAHGNVLRSPRSDARKLPETCDHGVRVAIFIEGELPRCE
jgi:hypothetical protein